MISRFAALCVLLLLTLLPAVSRAAPPATGFLTKTISTNRQPQKYVLFVPTDYDGKRKFPLILFLHGAGERGDDGLKQVGVGLPTAVMASPSKWPFLILIPQCPDGKRWDESQESSLLGMLAETKKKYKVDGERVYLTGLSLGGYGTWFLGARHPEMFAALAPICAGGDPATLTTLKSMPVWAFHGEADPTVPIERGKAMADAAKAADADVKWTTYPGVGHNSWDKAYREETLGDWLLTHTISGRK